MKKNIIKKQGREYPFTYSYPQEEDIYNKEKKEPYIEETDLFKITMHDRLPEPELDVPGSDPENNNGFHGWDDEENDYFSLGGEDHNDLEEDNL